MHKTSTLVLTSSEKTTKNKHMAETPVEIPEISDCIVRSILNYSKSLTLKRSALVGFIEVVAS